MFIELAGANCACGFLFWSRIPTQAGLANTRTVGYLGGGVLGAKNPKNKTVCLVGIKLQKQNDQICWIWSEMRKHYVMNDLKLILQLTKKLFFITKLGGRGRPRFTSPSCIYGACRVGKVTYYLGQGFY